MNINREIEGLEVENRMKTRIISGLAMVPLLGIVYLGGYWLLAAVMVVCVIGIREFYQGFQAMGINPSLYIGISSAFVLGVINIFSPDNPQLIIAWLAFYIMASLLYMFKINERKPEDSMATILGIIYVVFFAFHVTLVEQTTYGVLVWMILITAFGTDIMAYFTGVTIGKHKLCPDLSPKKTVEGAVGGVIGSMALSAAFGYFFVPEILLHCIILGLICSILSMMGDLTASAFKRKMGIKDYGNLIPGHGGIMDRFDSVLFTAPTIYYYIVLVIQVINR